MKRNSITFCEIKILHIFVEIVVVWVYIFSVLIDLFHDFVSIRLIERKNLNYSL